ncbi:MULTISPECIES: DUF3347 domain-containing protein [Mesonia]|uniref:Uncharacterized protein n=1 Tax=Mesonia oceanica TaxID=2687242 RepID=A0AC61YB56_9FLAO|nr:MULTISPECIES: DUF3347 domain-containing protein [Mesonia]MAN26405.1 hypothetical protein [Mesonia sp.]MAQ41785.1 hypothetical protein [Mesonia sp.]MBJ98295.1 hypothetical protein [Flavobacteriaceae bacterium]VVV01729.1 hypothetical protein FVB9532_03023 [Mesonia oceanica]|tara:strand:- start:69999 stop:70526 length:528 start_codon:yes stop_codon:yes gene_type:complete
MKRTILCLSLLALSFTACKNEGKPTNETSSDDKTEQVEKKKNTKGDALAFKSENQYEIAKLYLDMKNALVKGDAESVKKISEVLATKLENDENKRLAEKIAQKELESQRKIFFKLTENLNSLFAENITDGKLYKQYCPMAFDGKGAYWFSAEEEILNPYYGEQMLHCGRVEGIIK